MDGLPGPKARPGEVSVAAAMLFACAGIHAVQLLVDIAQIPTMRRELEASTAEAEALPFAFAQGTMVVTIVVSIVITAALAAGLAVLGALVAKGKQPARVMTWVVAGLLVLCTGLGLALNGYLAGQARQGSTVDLTPGWVSAWNTGSGILETLALVLVIILLAVPAANDYFRKELWIPPHAGPYPPARTGSMDGS
jgi:hypothetical protein